MSRIELETAAAPVIASAVVAYRGINLDESELKAAATSGLERAITRFVADRGYKPSTYVTWWIEQAIVRAIVARADSDGTAAAVDRKLGRAMRLRRSKR